MNAQDRFDYYIAEAAKVDPAKSVSALRKVLAGWEYTPAELKTDEQVIAAAKDSRTALLHRARAVKSTAKKAGIKIAA